MSAEGKLAAVIGWPVRQSVSPVLHSHWLKQHGIKGAYVALRIEPANFGRCVAALPLMGFAGASVTVPHKEAAFALVSSLDEDSRATGAVNTLVFKGDGVAGMNTDVRGFAASLLETLGADVARKGPAVVLGAGGAARATVLALQRAGSPEIRIINRTPARADTLARSAGGAITSVPWGDWTAAFADAALLVNTTSLGMTGKPPLEIALDQLPRHAAVADIVYNPLETDLLRAAKACGHRTMDGLGMLMHQAVPAFAAWFGVTPKVTPELRASSNERSVAEAAPFRVGLTGSIGMGKSETAKLFARLGLSVFDADAAVHALYGPGGAGTAAIARRFPDAVSGGGVDRARLAKIVAADEPALRELEALIHPLVRVAEDRFIDDARARNEDLVILDIPLLFETGRYKTMDAIVVVSAPEAVQRERVLKRTGMTPEKLEAILARQVPDAKKRAQADFVIETDKGLDHALAQVKRVAAELRRLAAEKRRK